MVSTDTWMKGQGPRVQGCFLQGFDVLRELGRGGANPQPLTQTRTKGTTMYCVNTPKVLQGMCLGSMVDAVVWIYKGTCTEFPPGDISGAVSFTAFMRYSSTFRRRGSAIPPCPELCTWHGITLNPKLCASKETVNCGCVNSSHGRVSRDR